jgi:rRNA maturation endonuclease Nob1
MTKLGDSDFGKNAHVCNDCDTAFFVGLVDVKHTCPKCGGKLQIKILTRSDTYDKDERTM